MRILLGFLVLLGLLVAAAAAYWAFVPRTIQYVAPKKEELLPSVLLETNVNVQEPIDLTPTP